MGSKKLTALGAFGVSLAIVSLLAARGVAADKPQSAAQIGAAAPTFSLQDQDGKTVALSDYAGKIVVLEWFNEECPFVVKHYKSGNMNDLASKYAGKDVVWLAINSTKGKTNDNNKAIASEWKIERPILNDATGEVGEAYGSKNTPTMYIIDKQGNLAYWGAIDNQPNPDPKSLEGATNYVSKALDELLAGQSVSEPKTKPYGCSVKYAK